MTDEKVINRILLEYEDLQRNAANDRKKRVADINARFPRLGEIDREIFERGKDNMNKIFAHPDKSDELNSDFKENLRRLTDEKNKIIKENNIDPDYDKLVYKCSICSDTGYTESGEKCKCFKQKLIDEAYSNSNMSEMIREQNFDSFSLKYYSEEKTPEGISARDNMVKIFSNCKKFCDTFDTDNKSLLFYGPTGLGKTFLSSSIAKELMDKGKTVVYVRATRLFSMYEDYRFGRNSDRSVIDNIYNADLLIIDDLGTEMASVNNVSFLFDVLNERVTFGKKMIINTNLGLGELTKMYSTRFTSRLYEYFNMYKFFGEDIRLQKLKNR